MGPASSWKFRLHFHACDTSQPTSNYFFIDFSYATFQCANSQYCTVTMKQWSRDSSSCDSCNGFDCSLASDVVRITEHCKRWQLKQVNWTRDLFTYLLHECSKLCRYSMVTMQPSLHCWQMCLATSHSALTAAPNMLVRQRSHTTVGHVI